MYSYKCDNGCCSVDVVNYPRTTLRPRRRSYKKAGVFIYDSKQKRVLLVQSRGHLWGPPKGTLEPGENDTECAIREVKEETGLEINPRDFSQAMNIGNKAMYFYLEMDVVPVDVQTQIDDNDANGITWIKVECLIECVRNGHIVLNRHCKLVFRHFLNIIFPKSVFTKVIKTTSRKK